MEVKAADNEIYHQGHKDHKDEMKPKRIHITGASGSGTTTLGAALSRRLGWKQIDADNYYWRPTTPPFQQKRDKDDRKRMILADFNADAAAIVSGSVISWGIELEDGFGLIVYLGIPAEIRLQRLRERELHRYGRINQAFIDWAALYEEGDLTVRSRRLVEKWLSERRAPVLRLEGDMTVEARVAAVLAQL